jgi:hypothetical protein
MATGVGSGLALGVQQCGIWPGLAVTGGPFPEAFPGNPGHLTGVNKPISDHAEGQKPPL